MIHYNDRLLHLIPVNSPLRDFLLNTYVLILFYHEKTADYFNLVHHSGFYLSTNPV